jgi:DnaJ-class molecular chaperone
LKNVPKKPCIMGRDYYAILGVAKTAEESELKKG